MIKGLVLDANGQGQAIVVLFRKTESVHISSEANDAVNIIERKVIYDKKEIDRFENKFFSIHDVPRLKGAEHYFYVWDL